MKLKAQEKIMLVFQLIQDNTTLIFNLLCTKFNNYIRDKSTFYDFIFYYSNLLQSVCSFNDLKRTVKLFSNLWQERLEFDRTKSAEVTIHAIVLIAPTNYKAGEQTFHEYGSHKREAVTIPKVTNHVTSHQFVIFGYLLTVIGNALHAVLDMKSNKVDYITSVQS